MGCWMYAPKQFSRPATAVDDKLMHSRIARAQQLYAITPFRLFLCLDFSRPVWGTFCEGCAMHVHTVMRRYVL